jgi:putative ABC transport system permease protein
MKTDTTLPWLVRAALASCARLVPTPERAGWLEEWTAEILAARRASRGQFLALELLSGAFRDALVMRKLASDRGSTGHPGVWRRRFGIHSLWKDTRIGVRSLLRQPGFTAITVVTIALGVGATTAMFSAVNSVLLRPLSYDDAESILVLRQTDRRDNSIRPGVSAANLRDLAAEVRGLQHVSGAAVYGFTLLQDGRAHSLRGHQVTAGFFEAIGAGAAIGRTFTAAEYVPGGDRVAILSYETWRARFGEDPGIVGRTLVLDGAPHTVVGVLPSSFKYPAPSEIWTPRPPQPWDEQVRAGAQMDAVARLATGFTPADAQAELDAIAVRFAETYPASNANTGFLATPLVDHLFGDVRSPLLLLLCAAALVLFVAAANVAGLQIARGAARSREYAVRSALGAGSVSIVRLVAIESGVLAIAGGAAGIGLAYLGVQVIELLGPDHLPRIDEIRVDGVVLLFAMLVSLGSVMLAGIAPAMHAARASIRSALAETSRGTTAGIGAGRFRDRLVIAEIALALVLTVGAGLLVRSFQQVMDRELGFDPANRLAVQVFAYDANDEPDLGFMRRGLERILSLPGVSDVGLTTALPLADNETVWSMHGSTRFSIDGGAASMPGSDPEARIMAVDGAFPAAMGISLVAGRTFAEQDDSTAPRVVMVNEAFVRRYLPGREAVGSRITLQGSADVSREIVGVLGDVRSRGLEAAPSPEIYSPYVQAPTTGGVTFIIRTRVEPSTLASPVQDAIWQVKPEQAIWAIQPLPDLLGEWSRQRRFNTTLLVAFAALALALAGIGIYGLMSFSVAQRISELGIRRALGADTGSILRIIMRRGLMLVASGGALGLVLALAVMRLLRGMLFDVGPFDPLTFAAVSLFTGAVALLSALLPARRAARVDPLIALRGD